MSAAALHECWWRSGVSLLEPGVFVACLGCVPIEGRNPEAARLAALTAVVAQRDRPGAVVAAVRQHASPRPLGGLKRWQ